MSGTEILFTSAGLGQCLYTEDIDLQTLGRLTIRRASFVEFNEEVQQWEVRLESGRVLYRNPSREDCITWERGNLGVMPENGEEDACTAYSHS